MVTSVTSDRLSASLGLFDRSMEEAVEGIRTTHAKDGIISLSGVIGDIFPLKKPKLNQSVVADLIFTQSYFQNLKPPILELLIVHISIKELELKPFEKSLARTV